MVEVEIVGPIASPEKAGTWIRQLVSRHSLVLVSEGTMAKYPGCVHWHLKKAGISGTLEATYWPKTRRFWFKVAANRSVPWINEILFAH